MKFRSKFAAGFGLFCLLLTLALVVFYFPFLSGARSFCQSDVTYYFEPFVRYICDEYQQGRMPLWNPYLYCGMSQIAVPSPGMFYPPTLFFMLPFSRGMASFLIFHQVVAGAGAFLLVAGLGWGLLAAAVAGTGVALCGYMFALQCNFTLVAAIAWLPLLLYGLRLIDETRSRRNILCMFLAAVSMALMVGAGRPELSVVEALIAGLFVCGIAYGDWCEGGIVRVVVARFVLRIVSLLAGGLLAMPVLLPALEWAGLSPRAHGLELKWVLMWSSNWYDCLCLLCAQPLGDLTFLGSEFLDMAVSRAHAMPYVTSSYVGPVVFCLAIWAMFALPGKLRWGIAAVGVALLLMALGSYTPIAPFICRLSPTFAAFRYPVKLMIFPALALVMLAAGGARCAWELKVPTAAQVTTLVLWVLLMLAGGVLLNFPSLASCTSNFPWNAGKPIDLGAMHRAQLLFGNSFIIAGGIGLAVNALYFVFVKQNISRDMFGVSLLILLVANLLWPAYMYDRHSSEADFYDRTPELVAPMLKELTGAAALGSTEPADSNYLNQGTGQNIVQRALPLYFDPLTPGNGFLAQHRIGYQDGFYLYARHLLLPNNNVDFHVPYAFGYEAAETGQYKTWFSSALSKSSQNKERDPKKAISDAAIARFCRETAVTLVLTQEYLHVMTNLVPKLDPRYFQLESDIHFLNVRKYTVRDTLPRAYFAGATKVVDWERFLALMLDEKNTAIPQETFVEETIPGCDSSTGGSISFSADEPNRVVLNTVRPTSGLLVLTDQFYPGWHAIVDGKNARIYRINGFARGIVLPAGRHRVEFRYLPESVAFGIECFGLVLLAFLAAFLFAKKLPL